MNIRELIPKHKHDTLTAEKLKDYSYAEIKPIIPDLLEWIQDMNWPVARPVAAYLETLTEYISEDILEILKGDDEVWKYWTIMYLGAVTQDNEVLNEIKRIAHNPTKAEIIDEVDEEARRILEERNIS
ncbi:MAG TPA: DUF5071 domain-containing protein [Chitinophagales bacterium]|nr:DUF5071 domain-containing protein [Chitinophagales bacterium]